MKKEAFPTLTNDKVIRAAIKANLQLELEKNSDVAHEARIIEELGITHGAARIDIAVVNGVIHGYELKSDLDTLDRLPEQMRIYNAVLDQITLVVGKNHLHEAIEIIPEWWGIMVAKITHSDSSKVVSVFEIREAQKNLFQDIASIASLLWREEALDLLEEYGYAEGVRSKNRQVIYKRLADVLDPEVLKARVREQLCARANWRSDLQLMPSDG